MINVLLGVEFDVVVVGYGMVWFGKAGRHEQICPAATVLCPTTYLLTYFPACLSVLFGVCRAGAEIGNCDERRECVISSVLGDPFKDFILDFLACVSPWHI